MQGPAIASRNGWNGCTALFPLPQLQWRWNITGMTHRLSARSCCWPYQGRTSTPKRAITRLGRLGLGQRRSAQANPTAQSQTTRAYQVHGPATHVHRALVKRRSSEIDFTKDYQTRRDHFDRQHGACDWRRVVSAAGACRYRDSRGVGDPGHRIRVGAALAAQSPPPASKQERYARLPRIRSPSHQEFPRVGVCTSARRHQETRQNERTKR